MAVAPTEREANRRLSGSASSSEAQVKALRQKISTMRTDPAYDHSASRAKLDAIDMDLARKEQLLGQELTIRTELEKAYTEGDVAAQTAARTKLRAHRQLNKVDYAGTLSLTVCQPCQVKKLASVPLTRQFEGTEAISDFITGVFEGKIPDYCAIADSPTDAGGLSYGKHQAAEKRGGLYSMCKKYVDSTDPTPNPATKSKFETQLALFNSTHNEYVGTPAQRQEFKAAMKEACNDPAMRKAQDEFFAEGYLMPALKSADALCVGSPLGKSMLYDLAIQSGPNRINTLGSKAMARTGKKGATQCQPCDPNGPTEEEFLKALNEERRKFVTDLGGDAAKSTYREDFYKEQLDGGNIALDRDFVVRGNPVKGLKPATQPPQPPSSPKGIAPSSAPISPIGNYDVGPATRWYG